MYITGSLNIHLQGTSREEVRNRTSQPRNTTFLHKFVVKTAGM